MRLIRAPGRFTGLAIPAEGRGEFAIVATIGARREAEAWTISLSAAVAASVDGVGDFRGLSAGRESRWPRTRG